LRVALCWLCWLGVLLAGSTPAFAHASLLRSEPSDGSILAEAPTRFVLTFNEPVAPTVVRLVESGGAAAELHQIQADGPTVTIRLPALGRGTHALSWRVISADGHPVGGTVVFSVGSPGGETSAVRTDTPPGLRDLIWGARLLLYLGLFIGVGGAFFDAWLVPGLRPRPAGPLIDAALVVGLASAAASAGLQGADTLGTDLGSLLSPRIWIAGAATTFGLTLAIGMATMALALLGGRVRDASVARALGSLALIGIGAALAASGHASDAQPQWLTRSGVFVHAVCIAFWIGALAPLSALLRDGHARSGQTLLRFSAAIPTPLALLVLTGLILAVIQVEHLDALWTTSYGRILVAKSAFVVALIGLGAWNRWRFTEAAAAGRMTACASMMRLVRAELIVALAILGLVAVWRFTPPPRALAAAAEAAAPIQIQLHQPQAAVDVTITPGHAGPVTISLSVLNGEMAPLPAKEVILTLANPGAGIEPIRAQARHIDGPTWRVEGLTVPAGGQWSVRVAVLVDEFAEAVLETHIQIPP
jgi:copper transport protein